VHLILDKNLKTLSLLQHITSKTLQMFSLQISLKSWLKQYTTLPTTHTHIQKLAAFHFYIQRLKSLPYTDKAKEQEWSRILAIAHTNGCPEHLILELKQRHHAIINMQTHQEEPTHQISKWSKFQFHSPAIYKITNMFKNTNVRIAFKATNTIMQQLTRKTKNDNPAGVYRIKCNTCNRAYVGQTGHDVTTRYKEHIRHIK
jgi:hypothetical protein